MRAQAPKQLKVNQSLDEIWREHVLTEAKLTCHPLTQGLVSGVGEALERLTEVWRGQRRCWADVERAQALVAYRSTQTNMLIEKVVKRLRFIGEQRGDSRFRYFFPGEPPNRVCRKGLAFKLGVMQCWPSALEAATDSELRAFGEPVSRALAEGEAAVRALDAANNATRLHRLCEIRVLITDINKQRDSLFAALLGIAAENGFGRAWARTFFK